MGRPKKYEIVEEARQARAKHAKERSAEIKLQEEELKKKKDVTANTARTARLQKTSASQRRKREEESTEEKLKRQKLDALAHKQKRQTETDEARLDRQERDAASHRELRKTEYFEATETKRAKDAISHRLSRGNKKENSKTQRLLKDRQIYTKRILAKANQNQQNLKQVAHNVTNDEASIIEHNVGAMDVVCESCGAYHFAAEKPSEGKFTQCCQKGKVDLPQVIVPSLMEALWKGKHVYSKNFMDNIASINTSFAFASMGAKIAPPPGCGPSVFRIHGTIVHRTGTLHPDKGEERTFAQLYILDPDEAAESRMKLKENKPCNENLLRIIDDFLNGCHSRIPILENRATFLVLLYSYKG